MNDPLEHKGLIIAIVNKYRATADLYSSVDYQDLIQEAWVAVVKCINKFDPSRGFAISTYLGRCIHTAIIDYLRGRSVFRRAKKWSGVKLSEYMLHSEEFDADKSNKTTASPELELEGQQEAVRRIKTYTKRIENRWYSKSTGNLHITSQKYYDMKSYLEPVLC